MTKKNIFVYKRFLLLNILDFSWFLCKSCNPPEKSHPLFPSNPPLKIEILSSPPLLFENLTPSPPAESVHYVIHVSVWIFKYFKEQPLCVWSICKLRICSLAWKYDIIISILFEKLKNYRVFSSNQIAGHYFLETQSSSL